MPSPDLTPIRPGLTGTASLTVAPEHTAPRIGSGRIAVLATPVMINLIEAAALAAVEHLLPAGHQSLGGLSSAPLRGDLDVRQAHDECEPIGDGTHQRVVVNVARFDERVRGKLPGARGECLQLPGCHTIGGSPGQRNARAR